MFYPYEFDTFTGPALRLVGVRPDRDGVRVTEERVVATFGFFNTSIDLDNIASASIQGPFRWFKVVGPRLSLADHGLTFGTTSATGVCLTFHDPIPAVVGPWRHPGLTVTVADPEGLVEAIGR